MKWIMPIAIMMLCIYLNNASWLRSIPNEKLSLLAHRGVHQTYSKEDLSKFGCTATRIDTPQHSFLENTIGSIEQSFFLGADIVEIDIHPTTDGEFAVFHDWTIDCRTNGKGKTREHSMTYLKSLDIGYGYTSDEEKSFPFRGKGAGKMPSLTEVLDYFPEQKFLINIKSNSPPEADLIAEFIDKRPTENLSRLSFYGGELPTTRLLSIRPQFKGFTKTSIKSCLIRYQLMAWTGYIPKACKNTIVGIPKEYAPYFWGWPRLLVTRMNKVNTDIILLDMSDGHTDGIDDPAEVQALSKEYRGIVWTDKIEQLSSIANSD